MKILTVLWRAGFNISNMGPKVKYDELGDNRFYSNKFKD
jgi:hypothetical protein